MSSWLETNRAFHAAARDHAAALASEFGLAGAYEHARERREQLPPGEAKVFAYNVEIIAAEAAGVSLDDPLAAPLGPEAPLWMLPFLTRRLLARLAAAAGGLVTRLHIRAAPDLPGVLGAYTGGKRKPDAATPLLTPRQIECLRWAAEGKSSTDIAEILGISAHTVDEHLDNACRRLGVRRRSQAIAKAVKAGILDPPPN